MESAEPSQNLVNVTNSTPAKCALRARSSGRSIWVPKSTAAGVCGEPSPRVRKPRHSPGSKRLGKEGHDVAIPRGSLAQELGLLTTQGSQRVPTANRLT